MESRGKAREIERWITKALEDGVTLMKGSTIKKEEIKERKNDDSNRRNRTKA